MDSEEVSSRRRQNHSRNSSNSEEPQNNGPNSHNNSSFSNGSHCFMLSAEREQKIRQLKEKASELKSNLLSTIDDQVQALFDDFTEEIVHPGITDPPYAKKDRKRDTLPDKEFVSRRSVLTELLEINHIRTIYHIFVAILIVFSLNTMIYDFIDTGTIIMNFGMISWAFDKFPIVMSMWGAMKLSTVVIVYPVFSFWASSRKQGKFNLHDIFWLVMYIVYQVAFCVIPIQLVREHDLPPASSVIICCEQIRLMMKAHAFVRENIPRVLKYSAVNDPSGVGPCPDFSKYLYFLFAPTLVYRDHYPRTPRIRWKYVVSNFLQVIACLFYIYYIFERFCVPVFRDFNREHVTPKRLLLSCFGSMMPGTLVLFIGFFAILHSWLNAFAEMMRFADRMFYKDWWNSSSFSNYYRTWNVVVHDWLYTYVYKDCYKLCGVPSRPMAMASVFLLSAVFHEYILIVTFRFFYPVLFFMFGGAGFSFIFLPSKAVRSGNVFMWVALMIGNGLLMTLYSMEWFARKNCPNTADSFVDYLIPRSWTCDFNAAVTNGNGS